jgi:hypothetical protein
MVVAVDLFFIYPTIYDSVKINQRTNNKDANPEMQVLWVLTGFA